MAELAHFKNFAKLKDTSIEFNDITVLAGKPGTGKSYVMKFIYGINESYKKALDDTSNIQAENEKHKEKLNSILEKAKDTKVLEKEFSTSDKRTMKEVIDILRLSLEASTLDSVVKKLEKQTKEYSNISQHNLQERLIGNIIKAIFGSFSQLSDDFSVHYKHLSVVYKDDGLNIKSDIEEIKVLSNVFVETPLILELHKHMDRREAKTRYHVESLLDILDEDYSFTDEEQDEFIMSFSKKANAIIGGDIKNSNGSFVFSRNNDKDYNIFNASSGIKSIGLLQYLVTNKALKKGSVLFWEEPEVHLHPEWQLKMVDLLVELMNAGVKIVFSTHSPYMADYLNAISQKHEFRDKVSFNLLKEDDGIVENVILDKENWSEIQSELLDPLEDIVWEYL
ncbi:MAG: ABC transporter ATP-binding protein [uncultured Sulfurovum sp.]|uniref:ABC transporter ATP-binding protein n=1 Tax=uncultured Sulfurovum sp. TaxID=269237 RepID=A0A6S6TTZ8_9BACT|nr:MAG: ABC transporter ATP-binding protein [uncultured Sulfurovum sp.]